MKKLTHTLLAVALLSFPAFTSAAEMAVLDTVAGLSTEVTISGLSPNATVTLSVTSPLGESSSYTLSAEPNGIARAWIAGKDLQTAGRYALLSSDDTKTKGILTVHPDSISPHRSFIETATSTANVGEEFLATAVLVDRFGNPLSGRRVELLSGRAEDVIEPLSRETNDRGEQDFLVRSVKPGVFSLRAVDLISGQTLASEVRISAGSTLGGFGGPVASVSTQQFYRSNPLRADVSGSPYRAQAQDTPRFAKFTIDIVGQEGVAVPEVEQGKALSMVLTAQDQYGKRYLDFQGTIYLATTDPDATLPLFGVYNFAFANEGSMTLTLGLKFATAGEHAMVLTESPDAIPADINDALGNLTVNVTRLKAAQSTKRIAVDSPSPGALLGKSDLIEGKSILVEGKGREFINISITGGKEEIESETDRQGNFSVSVPLDTTKTDQKITVHDVDAPQNSTERSFRIDVTPPQFDSITFAPQSPLEGSDVLVVVTTEPNVKSITLTLNGETHVLTTTDASSGKYQMLFTAPPGGTYEAIVRAMDTLENEAQETVPLAVVLKGLPKVTNVIAESQANAIALRWDPVTDITADAYRIYVGTDPDDFLYTLDTDRPLTTATIAGLRPGTTYFFAVTALQGPRESTEQSDIIDATVLGVHLNITPEDGALFIEWTSLQKNMPLANFLLEYGVEPDQFTEQRVFNSDLRAFTLRDLINGVPYYLKLTPVAVTGEQLSDLASTGQGTPTGKGFTAGTADPVPLNLDLHGSASPYAGPRQPGTVPLSEEGIPTWALFFTIGASVVLYRWYLLRSRDSRATSAFLLSMESKYHP